MGSTYAVNLDRWPARYTSVVTEAGTELIKVTEGTSQLTLCVAEHLVAKVSDQESQKSLSSHSMNRPSYASPSHEGEKSITGPERQDRADYTAHACSGEAPDLLGILLLVEDSAPMREAIISILINHFSSLHWIANGNDVLARAAELKPNIIVLDISLPGKSGLLLLPLLRQAHPYANIVMLTNHASELYRRQAFARGANAYVLKSDANWDLLPAIRDGPNRLKTAKPVTPSHTT